MHGCTVEYKEFSTIATQTDDNGCSNGCMSIYINTDSNYINIISNPTIHQQPYDRNLTFYKPGCHRDIIKHENGQEVDGCCLATITNDNDDKNHEIHMKKEKNDKFNGQKLYQISEMLKDLKRMNYATEPPVVDEWTIDRRADVDENANIDDVDENADIDDVDGNADIDVDENVDYIHENDNYNDDDDGDDRNDDDGDDVNAADDENFDVRVDYVIYSIDDNVDDDMNENGDGYGSGDGDGDDHDHFSAGNDDDDEYYNSNESEETKCDIYKTMPRNDDNQVKTSDIDQKTDKHINDLCLPGKTQHIERVLTQQQQKSSNFNEILKETIDFEQCCVLQLTREKFVCSYCSYVCDCQSGLDAHIRTHTKEKPFECTYCGKKFSQRGTLNRHTHIHTGAMPFHCSLCKMRFRYKRSLKDHIISHRDDNPFKCSFDNCSKSFLTKRRLTLHEKSHVPP